MTISIKKSLLFLGVWFCCAFLLGISFAQAQQITKGEYFFNQDPGYGKGISLPISAGEEITKNFTADISSLDPGFHNLFLRFKSANGLWTATAKRTFYKENVAAIVSENGQLPNITGGEFFFNTDPGYGQGQPIPITPGQDLSNVALAADISSLDPGFHTLHLRFKSANGLWTATAKRTFYKENVAAIVSENGQLPNITGGEFFFNTDPGYGQGQPIPITPGQDLSNVALAADISSLDPGFHNLFLRFKSANGLWTATAKRTFYKENVAAIVSENGQLPNITGGEFFFNTDPGYGQGQPIPITPGQDLSNVALAADISSLDPGFHTLHLRFKSANGLWTATAKRTFYKEDLTPIAGTSTVNIVKGEYFIDTDPGYGLGTDIPFTPAPDVNNIAFALNMDQVSVGNHKLYLRFKDANGVWSAITVKDFQVEAPLELVISLGSITGPLCANTNVAVPFTVNGSFGSNNIFTAQLSDDNGSFANPVAIGTLTGTTSGTINGVIPANTAAGVNYRVRVISSSPDKISEVNTNALTINRLPENFSVSGLASTCVGSQTYTTDLLPQGNLTYSWSVTGGGVLTANGNSATISWATAGIHTIKLTATNDCGNSVEKTLVVSVSEAAPSLTPTVTTNGRWMYASTPPSGSGVTNYQWYENGGAVSGATTSTYYAYNNGATYTVRYQNACGTGPESNPVSYIGDKQNQTISFSSISEKTFGDAPFTVQASASSGLSVTYSIISGPATVSGNTVTITGAGSVTVQALQAGNAQYNAVSTNQTFTVKKAAASLVLANLTQVYNGSPKAPSATTTPAGLSVTYTYDGSSTAPTHAGSYALVATISNSNYAGTTNGTFVIEKASQTIALEAITDKSFGSAPFTFSASATSGLPVALTLETTPAGIATLTDNTITILGTGTATVRAAQAGNDDYLPAPGVSDDFIINKATQTITFAPLPNRKLGDAPFDLDASSSSSLPVSFRVTSGPATLDGNILSMNNTGTVVIEAYQAGNQNFQSAPSVSRSFEVSPATKLEQTITFAALSDKTYGDAPFNLSATASSNLPVSFSVVSGPATLVGNLLSISGAGTVTVQATQAGNTTYNPASVVERSFTVGKATATVSLAGLTQVYNGSAKTVTASTTPTGLPVIITYDGKREAPQNAGTYAVEAVVEHDNYQGTASGTLTIQRATQTITFASISDKVLGAAPFELIASSSANLPVTFTLVSGPATISGNMITLDGIGTVKVRAVQEGNTNFQDAEVERTFQVLSPCGSVALTHTRTSGYTGSWVEPNVGTPSSTFYFEVTYTDAAGNMPKAGFPKLQLDFNNDGDYLDPQDRVISMVPATAGDTDVTDGKRYVAQVSNLLLGTYSSRILVENEAGCTVTSTKVNEPFVSDNLLDLAIFANDITFSNGEPEVDETITISARIHNNSDFAASNFVVKVYSEDDLLFTQTVSSLAAQSQTTLQWQHSFPKVQFYPVKVVIDATEVLPEKNELNNFAIRPVVVGGYNVLGGIAIEAQVTPDSGPAYTGASLVGKASYEEVYGSDFDVSGAEVKAKIVETGQTLQTYTDANGNFRLSFTRPGAPGEYHVAISVTDFTLTGKNTVVFQVTAPVVVQGPNLYASITGISCVPAGTSVNNQVTVHNNGQQAAGPFQVRLYQGSNTLSVTSIPGLASGASFAIPVNVSYDQEGSYSIYASVDETNQVAELSEGDNNRVALSIGVVPNKPDLVALGQGHTGVGTYNPADPTVPVPIHIGYLNRGGIPAGAFQVKVYLGSTLIHTESISGVEACSGPKGFTFTHVFGAFGTYNLTAVVDEANVIDEALENNNTYQFQFVYPAPQINLAMSRISVVPAEPTGEGAPLTLVTNYRNTGFASVPAEPNFAVGFDLNIAGSLSSVSEMVTDGVPFQTDKTTSKTIATPSFTDNRLTVRLDATNVVSESSEGDNTGSVPLCWDFTLGSCPSVGWPSTVYVNDNVSMVLGLYNKGIYQGSNIKTAIYINGTLFNVQETATLAGLNWTCIGASHTFTEPGEYTIRFVTDHTNKYSECNEDNNAIELKIRVLPPLPDLQILSQHISPTELNPDPNEPVQIFLSFKNTGRIKTGPFTVRGAVDDVTLGESILVPGLRAGKDTTVALTASYSSSQIGSHIIRGFVDDLKQVEESDELNNEASRAIIVGEAANLMFTNLGISTLCPTRGNTVVLTPTVMNEGDLAATGVLRLSYVTAMGDTILIVANSVNLEPKQSFSMEASWQVVANTTAIFAELVNTSEEFNYFDNSTVKQLCSTLLAQTITFDAIPDKILGNAPFTLSATSSSGLGVEFSIVSGPASVTGNTVTLLGAGPVLVRASQNGNGVYAAAAPVDRSFTVAPSHIITTLPLASTVYTAGHVMMVPFTQTGLYSRDNNRFQVQLSDASGSFAAPRVLASYATPQSPIYSPIPADLPTGSGYRVRVVSTDPVVIGSDSGQEITILGRQITTLPLASTVYTAGHVMMVPFTQTGLYSRDNNRFQVQLSDASGSFAAPRVLASYATPQSPIYSPIPADLPTGSGYRVRVVSTDPVVIGSDSGQEITILGRQITTLPLASTVYTAGHVMMVPFTQTGLYSRDNNRFQVQLSDASGSFAAPRVLASYATPQSPIYSPIPADLPTGSGYRVRVVSTDPVVIGSDSGQEITILGRQITTLPLASTTYKAGHVMMVPFTQTGLYSRLTNRFQVQLSDATGSFAAPRILASYATPRSPIFTPIPTDVPSGTGYRVRVVSTDPVVIGSDSGQEITIIGTSATASISTTNTTVVADAEDRAQLDVYPNPSTSRIVTIRVSSVQELDGQPLELEMLDLSGRSVLHKTYKQAGNLLEEQLDLAQLRNGMYIIRFRTAKKVLQTRLILE